MNNIVRAAEDKDLESIRSIYNYYVSHTHVTFDIEPLITNQIRTWAKINKSSNQKLLFVSEFENEILGFAKSGQFRNKPAYYRSVETSIYMNPECTNRGIGSELYSELLAALKNLEFHRAYAGIALPNDASIEFHRKFGFISIGIFEQVGYKFGKFYDVEWFQKSL